jgi:hypothetical protein
MTDEDRDLYAVIADGHFQATVRRYRAACVCD